MDKTKEANIYDVVVIGGGPAGLTAALYLARARYRVIVVEKEQFGGQITITSEVVNYPGAERISGTELTDRMRRQAESFGAEFLLAEAEALELSPDIKKVHTSRGVLECFGILLATGAHPRQVGFKGEEAFRGHGVAYCATCDGEFFTGKDVFVVGGGFAAAEESVFLTRYARHVTILIRGSDFSCARVAADAARKHEKITVLTNTQIEEAGGDSALRRLRYRNSQTGEVTEYQPETGETFGIFVFAGYEPASALARGLVDLDEKGYVLTDRNQKTSQEGVYAAGDICVKHLRQVVTAVGDGALAATELERYVKEMQEKSGIRPKRQQAGSGAEQEPAAKKEPDGEHPPTGTEGLFTEDMLAQLKGVFEKMEQPLLLRLYLDDRSVSRELEGYMEALAELTEKIQVERRKAEAEGHLPCVRICLADGTDTGLVFHGVPGGHEFTSFVLGLYNVAGPGQMLDPVTEQKIREITRPVHIRVMVSLSCTMCPELVTAVWKISAVSPYVTAEIFDLNHFQDMKEKYQVMSVPCMVIDEDPPSFGKKNIRQVLEMIGGNGDRRGEGCL